MSLRLRLLTVPSVVLAALALAACGSGDATAPSAQQARTPHVAVQTAAGFDAQGIYNEAAPSVVTIRSVFSKSAAGALGGGVGQGSGFVLNEDGEIVTNAHVVTDGEAGGSSGIQQADEVFIEFGDRNQVPAEVIGFDPNADVALLKVEPDGLDLNPIELGDSDKVEVGEPVAAIGSPFGQEQSLSVGIVSATDRAIDSLTQFSIDGAIQTDASINPGNSGGPLIDPEGKVIGINQQINTTSGGNEGVGFAVPVNLVKRSIDDLRPDGVAKYAYIGVTSQPLYPQLADKLGIDAPSGSLIATVEKGGPAEQAGLRGSDGQKIEFQGQQIDVGGDVITAVDGHELVDETDLSILIAQHQPGQKISLDIIRDGNRQSVDVTLGERPEDVNLSP